MESTKVIHAIYTDDDVLMSAVKKVKAERYHIEEIYTPFPVHGLDKAMGLAPTRIAITAFIYGLIGLTVAIVMMNFIMIEDWPQDIGGKPSFSYIQNMPAFVPIMFELTVFLSLISYADCSKNVFNEQDHLLVLIEKKEPNDHSIVAHPLRRHE